MLKELCVSLWNWKIDGSITEVRQGQAVQKTILNTLCSSPEELYVDVERSF